MRIKDYWAETFIFLASLAIRIPRLGWDIFNADAFRWKARSFNFCDAVFSFSFAGTAQTAHPGVTLMWLSTLAIKIYGAFNKLFRAGQAPASQLEVFELHFVQKFVLVVVISLLVSLSFYLLKKLTNCWIASFSVLLLTIEPFFLAHTRVYHLDALLAMLIFVSVLALLVSRPLRSRKSLDLKGLGGNDAKYLVLSAVFAALALLTKSTALFLIPFSAVLVFVDLRRKLNRSESMSPLPVTSYQLLVTILFWLLVTTAAFAAVWPSMWVQPLKTLQLYFSGIFGEGFAGHGQVIFGQATTNPGWFFYPLSLWIRLSPWLLGLAGLGVFDLVRRIIRHSEERSDEESQELKRDSSPRRAGLRMTRKGLVPLISLLFTFLYLSFISIPSKKLERYSLPVYPFLAILASYGLKCVVMFSAKASAQILKSKAQNPNPSTTLRPGKIQNPKLKKVLDYARTVRFLFFERIRQLAEESRSRHLDFELWIFRTGDLFVLGLGLLFFSFSGYQLHPDYLAYYSPLAGGFRGGIEAIRPDWALGAWRVGEYLNAQPNASRLRVLVPETDQFRPFIASYVFDSAGVEDFGKFDYVVLPVWDLKGRFEGVEPEEVVEIAGVGVYNIYWTGKISN